MLRDLSQMRSPRLHERCLQVLTIRAAGRHDPLRPRGPATRRWRPRCGRAAASRPFNVNSTDVDGERRRDCKVQFLIIAAGPPRIHSPCQPAPIHCQGVAGDHGGPVAREEKNGGSHFLRLNKPSERGGLQNCTRHLWVCEERIDQGGFCEGRRDRIDPNAMGGPLHRSGIARKIARSSVA